MAIVAASILVGSRVLAGADDTVAVWAVADDVGAGEAMSADDLVAARVHFADGDRLERYFTVDVALPEDLRLLRALGAGELLPRAAVGSPEAIDTVEVSVPVGPLLVPPAVAAGSVVDVYLSDRGAAADVRSTRRDDSATGVAASPPVLSEVTVVAAPPPDETFAASGDRQIVLAVATESVGEFYGSMDAMADPVVTIVRHG